jgi:hypothetical protein
MHIQEQKSLKHWEESKSKAGTGFSEQLWFSTPPGTQGGCWRRNETTEWPERVGVTLLLEQRSTFSENKNFSNKRIFSKKKMKLALVCFLFLHVIGLV